ncbi:hypothetical protein GGTG_04005 [Gaeumannomyces tritici R3-111a-1]|uniref:Uncharacterized protein n=1 Tax=Gaeumannomyces tritici (strain R3-111a-1) TaxID=644352 RepID=J3NRV6_GAET3|nr:hypothetical protein GGTG_04005 [Gaeumannomyces tritici R3-111a-1]EJT78912.1 hypothetical protein GGTG_04005 [Gaeumannomyces tritici R3-111a-1]
MVYVIYGVSLKRINFKDLKLAKARAKHVKNHKFKRLAWQTIFSTEKKKVRLKAWQGKSKATQKFNPEPFQAFSVFTEAPLFA